MTKCARARDAFAHVLFYSAPHRGDETTSIANRVREARAEQSVAMATFFFSRFPLCPETEPAGLNV